MRLRTRALRARETDSEEGRYFGSLESRKAQDSGSADPSSDPPTWGGGETVFTKPKVKRECVPPWLSSQVGAERIKSVLVMLSSCDRESRPMAPARVGPAGQEGAPGSEGSMMEEELKD